MLRVVIGLCMLCGGDMLKLKCKAVCQNCGYIIDCSDW